MSDQKRNRSSLIIALLCGVLGTFQYHSAQFLSGFDTFFGDRGDARGFVYFCEHWYQSLIGKASLLSPAIFYPTKGTLAYSDLLVGVALPYSLFRALGFGMFSAVEGVVILTTFLSYCAAFWLLHKTLEFRLAPAIVGAMFFAFSGPKFFQTIHLQLQLIVLLPVIFALLITFAKEVRSIDQRRAAVLLSLAGLCFVLQLATAFYYAWFFVFWAVLFLLVAVAIGPSREFVFTVVKKFWRALLIAAVVSVVAFIPVLLIYLPALRLGTWYRYDFVVQMIPDWRSLLVMGDGNYLWGRMPAVLWGKARPDVWGEIQVGIGALPSVAWIVLTVASLYWIVKRRRVTREEPRSVGEVFLVVMILATTVFYLVGFKYAGHSPWAFIYGFFPGAGAIRAVARYVIFLTLPMSIGFAYALNRGLAYASRLSSPQRRRVLQTALIVVAAFGVFEQFGVNKISGTGFSTSVEDAYLIAMAAKVQHDCGAFYIAAGPHGNHSIAEYHYDAMLLSILSGVPTFNASSSQFPRDWNLYFIKNPDYEDNVRNWINSQHIATTVCRLEIGPEVEAFDPRFPSPIDYPEFFVRQLYRDFTNQEPENEVKTQLAKLSNCRPDDDSCTRDQVALNVFLASGFHDRGFFILRMYEAALNRLPHFDEFMDEMNHYYPPQVTKEQTIQRLVMRHLHQLPIDEKTVAQLADSDDMMHRLGNRSFVALHYYGFLRREPDAAGLENWVALMDRSGDAAKVTKNIIESVEYRQRFRN
jgi:hypothetical protein